jgi:predicted ribosomally synthesized peptide with SipW-like signal peptide
MKKGKITIFASIFIMTLVAAGASVGTQAYFSETEAAAITFTAGTVNLRLSKDSGASWHDGLSFSLPSNWAPGDVSTIEIWLKNVGTTGMENLFVTGDNLAGSPDKSLSDVIHITDVAYTDRDPNTGGAMWVHPASGTYYQTTFGDNAAPFTLRELANGLSNGDKMNFCWGTPGEHGDYLPAGGARIQKFMIEFTFDANAGNSYQGKTVSFDLLFKATDEPATFVWWP